MPDASSRPASRWRQHLTLDLPTQPDTRPVWLHACSVGEVNSVVPLIEGLLDMGYAVHLTVVTDTGYANAQRLFAERITLAYLPWDIPGLMGRMISRLNPLILLLAETEFWPFMLRACYRRGIPVIGINTRISDRSFPRYMASRWLWKRWLAGVSLFLAQGEVDADRLIAMGVVPKRVRSVGHLKYAVRPPVVDSEALRRKLDASGARPILLAGSTHADEETQLCRMLPGWKAIDPGLLLVVVPRHPQRFDEVNQQMATLGIRTTRWSEGPADAGHDAMLVDAMGVLGGLYTTADLVFVGGSLIPHGGQNPLEAAVCGRGVVTGPHMHNFAGIMQDMKQAGAAVQCDDGAAVDAAISRFLSRPDELRQLHAHAAAFMQDRADIARRMLKAIRPWLAGKPARKAKHT